MKFTIVHLYHDLLNLYGASGNIKVLRRYLENQGVVVEVIEASVNSDINYESADMIYLSSGTEESLELARKDLLQRKNNIITFIDSEKFIYAEGNSLELFCNTVNGKEGLALYDYDVTYHDRIKEEVDFVSSLVPERIYGFINAYSLIEKNDDLIEYGFIIKNLTACYLLGPIFARNPHLTEFYVKKMMNYLDPSLEIKNFANELDHQAYIEYIEILNN